MAQHDYVIANGTGAAVRSDLNNALAAIVSQNSGATAPATTYAFQFWADTTTGLLKLRNSSNNAWVTLFQLDGEWSTLPVENGTAAAPSIYFKDSGTDTGFFSPGTNSVAITTDGTQRVTVDSSGRLLVGTSSTSNDCSVVLRGRSGDANGNAILRLERNTTSPADGDTLGNLSFGSTGTSSINAGAWIIAGRDGGTWTNGSSHPSRLVFSTTADGASSPTERMRIANDGSVQIGVTNPTATSYVYARADGGIAAYFDRQTNDGDIVAIRQAGITEGTISVSGTTVSYNGAHLSRWSQLPGGAERADILRGTVLSNIDEMCEWGEEDNEQLNRMKVSDVEGDKNVSGVFQAWDDDDDTYTNDFYCAMTGDFIIRIAEGVTVERGDLLVSAGDGTAKPQDDDIIRSKTIAKVTSTNVSCTYDDGSYCVPCVLMAC